MPLDNLAHYEFASPWELSQEPAFAALREPERDQDWGQVYSHLEQRLGALRMWRYSFWAHWAQLAEYILPSRYHWLVVPNTYNRGHPINNTIVDSTATLAMQVAAGGLWTGLTSPSRPWVKIGIALPWIQLDAAGKEWLEDTEQRLYQILGQSNFYTTMAQMFKDVVTFATSPVLIYEDYETVIRCRLPCAGEYYCAAGSTHTIDTLYFEFNLTIIDIVEMFGLESCPLEVQELWEAGGASLENEMVVACAIEPNFAIAGRGATKKQVTVVSGAYPFREVYWLKGKNTSKPLSKRGFWEKPFFVARWATRSNDPYGRQCPGMDALGDIKQLQQETRRKGEFIDKLVRPPMIADPEMKNQPSSIISGHVTYTSTVGGKKGFIPAFEVQPAAMQPMVADIKEIQDRIKECHFVNIFMAITQMEGVQPRNELELSKRDLERLQVLGPFVEQFETECADPAVHRVLAIMQRRGLLRPKPPSLRNVPLKLEYVSIMRQAQRSAESVAMKDTFQVMGLLSAAAKAAQQPDPIRVINLDKALRKYAEISNFPIETIYTDAEVQQADQGRAQQAQQAAATQQAMAAVEASKTLSQASLQPGNALSAIAGAVPGGGA